MVAGVFQQVVDCRRIGVPIALVDQLGEHQIVAGGGGRLVIDLRGAEEPPKLETAEDIRNDVGTQLPGLGNYHAEAAGVLVAVPAAGQVARREDHAGAAAEVDPFEAGRPAEGRAIALLVGQVAELVVRRIDRFLGQHGVQGAAGEDQFNLAAERLGEIVPAATGVGNDCAAVHYVAGQFARTSSVSSKWL